MWNSDFDRKTKYFKLKNQVFNPYTKKPKFFDRLGEFQLEKVFLSNIWNLKTVLLTHWLPMTSIL